MAHDGDDGEDDDIKKSRDDCDDGDDDDGSRDDSYDHDSIDDGYEEQVGGMISVTVDKGPIHI